MNPKALRLDRRRLLGVAAAAAVLPWRTLQAAGDAPIIEVYKSPACGCCHLWVEHLEASGFEAEAKDMNDLAQIKMIAGVPDHLTACHTALVDGFVVEGHVPASAVQRLLDERPDVRGLAVPGMPAGSPGMPDPHPERYDVIAFGRSGEQVFMSFVETDPV